MSNIDDGPIDPGKGKTPPPDVIPPEDDPDVDHVGSDEIKEPADDIRPVEPDPEEGGRKVPGGIRRAGKAEPKDDGVLSNAIRRTDNAFNGVENGEDLIGKDLTAEEQDAEEAEALESGRAL